VTTAAESRVASAPGRARTLFELAAPRSRQLHLFEAAGDPHVLISNGDRIFQVDRATYARLERALAADSAADVTAESAAASIVGREGKIGALLNELGLDGAPLIDDTPLCEPPIRALSLAVAQKCNLGCTYCYAQQGAFGGAPKSMDRETARQAVDLLLRDAAAGERFNLSFLGGEPLVNREVIRAATERGAALAKERGALLTFSITTNGTLLSPRDAEFFERFGFAVTISIDGSREQHDRLRPFKGGRGSYDMLLSRVEPLLAAQVAMQVSARVTVTPVNLDLRATLDELVGLGFHSVGFSPMLSSPTGRNEMGEPELEVMLGQMVECGAEFERRLAARERYPFMNMVNALREIHKGTHRPYSCGAGAGYLGVSADGDLAACHRFVGDAEGAMGDVLTGIDRARQAEWLSLRHVHRQEPCRDCWARYMCGGGCHHEVIHRGRPACGYIRGWLHYCLQAYVRLSMQCPEWFTPTRA
jgi:uncharacterized protein